MRRICDAALRSFDEALAARLDACRLAVFIRATRRGIVLVFVALVVCFAKGLGS